MKPLIKYWYTYSDQNFSKKFNEYTYLFVFDLFCVQMICVYFVPFINILKKLYVHSLISFNEFFSLKFPQIEIAIPIPYINDGTPGHWSCLNFPPFIEFMDLLTKLVLFAKAKFQLRQLRHYSTNQKGAGSNPVKGKQFFKYFLQNLTKMAGDLNMINDLEYHHICRESVQHSHSNKLFQSDHS